uniref:E3 ubiquitin-protein ligase n=1 Tax=Sinocyclocheilus grahami TaxID=75366 RepID=A0A672P4H8_SINGR
MATGSSFHSGGSGSRNGPSFASPSSSSSGVPGQAQPMAVVWEWQDDLGYWRPYTGQVSSYIEQCLQHQRGAGPASSSSSSSSICLAQADPSLSAYIIDIPNLKQFRQDTGKMRAVRRSLFPQSFALGSGVLWEWANDEGGWTVYEIRTSILLEHSYQAGQATADLSPHGYNYIVDLTALQQVNKATSYRRHVRRQGSVPYPLASGSVIHSGPACSCHQCLSNSSAAGPMMSRSRHSFTVGQANGPSLQTQHGRLPGTSSSSAYSPYPRRPLSMGSLLWNGPWSTPTSVAHPSGPPQAFGHHANGLSISTIPLHMNGSSSVNSALAGTALTLSCIYKNDLIFLVPKCIFSCKPFLSAELIFSHLSHFVTPQDGSLQCPSCKTIYGEKTGTQPKGKMEIYSIPQSLPGHPDCGTIQIIYNIPPGIQGPEHPNPGQPYTCRGFPRFCFLPDNDKGRKVLELLKVAWTRRLIFTVGTSSTTGEPDTVIWNEIHHKTEMMSNVSGHGYPDPNYLDNVLSELASQGVTEDCLKLNPQCQGAQGAAM